MQFFGRFCAGVIPKFSIVLFFKVNGVPSSESNPPAPQPSQVPALSSVSSPSTSFKSSSSSPHLTLFGQNLVSTTLTTSMSSPATSVGQIQTSASLTPQTLGLTTAPVLHSLSTSTPAPGLDPMIIHLDFQWLNVWYLSVLTIFFCFTHRSFWYTIERVTSCYMQFNYPNFFIQQPAEFS